MGMNEREFRHSVPVDVPLPEIFRVLNEQRLDIDRRLAGIPAGNPARESLWLELDPILAKIREVVGDLAKSPATSLPDVQAKAAVLASLIRPEQENGGPIIPELDKLALTLSLTDDIAQLARFQ